MSGELNRLMDIENEMLEQRKRFENKRIQKPPKSMGIIRGRSALALSKSISYTVPGTLPRLKQPNLNGCWATVTAMIISWRDNLSLSVRDAAYSIGKKWGQIFDSNQVLLFKDHPRFLAEAGLIAEPPMSFSIKGWENLLRTYGPIWVTSDEKLGYGTRFHTRLVFGIEGDGTPDKTYLKIIDPGTGKVIRESVSRFLKKYEELVGEMDDTPIQVVHLPKDAKKSTAKSFEEGKEQSYGMDRSDTTGFSAPMLSVLTSGQVLDVEIRDALGNVSSYSHDYSIDPTGCLEIPAAGCIKAKGLTLDKLREEIKKAMSGILVTPTVNVTLSKITVPYGNNVNPGDTFFVRMLNNTGGIENKGDYPVDTKGMLHLPLVGDVSTAGKTIFEVEEFVEKAVRAKYIRGSVVHVWPTKAAPLSLTHFYAEMLSPAPGSNPGSTKAAALVEAGTFASHPAGSTSAAFKLSHADVSNRLKQLINDPDLVQQGTLNLCGPAAFFHILLKRDPLTFARYAAALYLTGRSALGGLTVTPDDDLKTQTYNASWGCPSTDWMTMSSLRDDENWLLDYEGTPSETTSAATTPAELKKWLKATSLYKNVKDEGNWMLTKGVSHAKGLSPGPNTDIALLINAHILSSAAATHKKSDEFILKAFPNHFVVLNTPIVETGGKIEFKCWTWGGTSSVSVKRDTFEANYYGAVIANK